MSRRLMRNLIITGCILCLFIVGVLIVIPHFAIKYVEKHDKEWIQRDVTIEKVSFNPFRLRIVAENVRLSEPTGDATFISIGSGTVNLQWWPLIKSRLIVEELKLDGFHGSIIQNGNLLNFSDLLENISSEPVDTSDKTGNNWYISIEDLQLTSGSLVYQDVNIGSTLTLDTITLIASPFSSNDSVFICQYHLHQKEGGLLNGSFSYNLEDGEYHTRPVIENWQLNPYRSYVTTAMHLGRFEGNLVADFRVTGNALSRQYIAIGGVFDLNDFEITDPENDSLLRIGSLHLEIDSLNSFARLYDFRDVTLSDAYLKFEYLPNGDNFTNLLKRSPVDSITGSNPTEQDTNQIIPSSYYASPFEFLALYIYDLTKEYIFSAYEADSIVVSNFNLDFYDFTLEDPFSMQLTELTLAAGNIELEDQDVDFNFRSKLNTTGLLDGHVRVSREGARNMDVDFEMKGIFLTQFSPYSRFYTAHPFWEGAVTFNSSSTIKDYYIISNNHLFVEKIEVGDKNKTSSGHSLPMKLAVAIIRDVDGNVDLEIPIEGQLDDPKYKLGKVIWQVLKNLIVKAGTAPFRLLANAFNADEEDLKNISFDNGQHELGKRQLKALSAISNVLKQKPSLTIRLDHIYNPEYEIDALAIRKAKGDYLENNPGVTVPTETDSSTDVASTVSNTDSLFINYFASIYSSYNPQVPLAENARKRYGDELLRVEMENIMQVQKDLVSNYLFVEESIPQQQVTISDLSNKEIAINQVHPKFAVTFGSGGPPGGMETDVTASDETSDLPESEEDN